MNIKSNFQINRFNIKGVMWVMLVSSLSVNASPSEQESKNKSAIEVLTNIRIVETVKKDGRPAHVYRPRTPIFHIHHPENQPKAPFKMRHPLVTHPELENK